MTPHPSFDDVPDLALRGEAGIDIFARLPATDARLAHYRCIATLTADDALQMHERLDGRDEASLRRTAAALPPVGTVLTLGDSAHWGEMRASLGALRLFQHLEFLREWQVADIALSRWSQDWWALFSSLPYDAGKLVSVATLMTNFNRLSLAAALTDALCAHLDDTGLLARTPHGSANQTGYALRMLGDLALRAGDATRAVRCFEASVAAGDNSHRRRRLLEAALALGDETLLARHVADFTARWPLPDDLRAALAQRGLA